MARLLLLLSILLSLSTQAQPTVKWSFNTKDASFGQSASADIDGDGKLEIVFGCYRNDSMIYALNAENGSLLWKFNAKGVASEGCNDVAPIIYDVDGDGKLEVIVPSSCNPKTFCLDGKTGAVKWVCNTRGSDSPPTIADIDGDGKTEILHGEFGGYVICINAEDGTKAWEIAVDTKSWIQTAPTIVDVNNDGDLDFVVGTWNASVKTDNKIYAYRAKDQKLLWTYAVNDVMYHGTAVGDLDKDGKQELVVGCYNDTLYCINAENGTTNWKYSFGNSFYVGGPALIADLNNDGRCEVVFSAWYKMAALTWDGKLFWEYNIPNYKQSFRGAAIADVNNNAFPDVVFGTDGGSVIGLNGQDGSLIFNKNLRSDFGDSLYAIDNAPLIADFDKDGKMDVFIVGGHGEYPDFFKDFGRAYLLSIAPGNGPDWLMFQNDIWRRSNICEKKASAIEDVALPKEDINIYPNPSFGVINIELTLKEKSAVSIALYNLQGQKINNKEAGLLNCGKHLLLWDTPAQMPAGMYYFAIKIGNAMRYEKLLLR
jgi:outer membrane protein assembly factor BamB